MVSVSPLRNSRHNKIRLGRIRQLRQNLYGRQKLSECSLFTVKFTVVSVITVNILAFALAKLLTRGIKGTNLFRTVFFMPNLIAESFSGYIWQILINGILMKFGLPLPLTPNTASGAW
jgi:raffinose/stachyose/melibiose transport system permease protein